ncbi:MAG: fibronectin type III domain-containing protein [Saprospiraceae bacterium]
MIARAFFSYMYKSFLIFTLSFFAVVLSFSSRAQNEIAAGDFGLKKSVMALTLPKSDPFYSKPKKNLNSAIPNCGKLEWLNFTDVTSSSITIQWPHKGLASKSYYEIILVNQTTLEQYLTIAYSPLSGDQTLSYVFTNCDRETIYDISVTVYCDFSSSPNYNNYWVASESLTQSVTTPNCSISTALFAIGNDYQRIVIEPDNDKLNLISGMAFETVLRDVTNGWILDAQNVDINRDVTGILYDNLNSCTNYLCEVRPKCLNLDNTFSFGNWISVPVKTKCCGSFNWVSDPIVTENSIEVSWNFDLYNQNDKILVELFKDNVVVSSIWLVSTYSYQFTNLLANTKYEVRITPGCRCGDNQNFITCATKGTSITKNVITIDPCGSPKYVSVLNITPSKLSVSIDNYPSSSQRKLEVKVSNQGLVKTESRFIPAGGASNSIIDFEGLTGDTVYNVEVKMSCCVVNTNCAQLEQTKTVNTTARTLPAICTPPAHLSVDYYASNSIQISWEHNPDATAKRYRIFLYNGSLVEKDTTILLTAAGLRGNYIFYGLTPNTNYKIVVQSDCCQNQSQDCNVWLLGEVASVLGKTDFKVPDQCANTPTVFNAAPSSDEIELTWTGANTTPLSPAGRRFVVTYGNPQLTFVIDADVNNIIRGLQPYTNYTLKIREVFDGLYSTFTEACAEIELTVRTTLPETQCDSIFSAMTLQGPLCGDAGNFAFDIAYDTTKNSNGFRIHYRDVTPFFKNADSGYIVECATLTGPTISSATNNKIEWQHRDVEAAHKISLIGLNPCSTYEIQIESFKREKNGTLTGCALKTFTTYFNTKQASADEAGITDVDKDGIPDECDDKIEVKAPSTVSTNLQDLICGADPALPSFAGYSAYSTGAAGDIWYINNFPFEIRYISTQSTNTYSGDGYLSLPFEGLSKLKVNFDNIVVKTSPIGSKKTVTSGKVFGLPEGESVAALVAKINAAQLQTTDDFCQPLGFDKNGENKYTGEKWDNNGFDKSGKYVKAPPYEGYVPNGPYTSQYDPNGFDKNGKFKDGTKYNDCGCDRDGNSDPSKPGSPCKPDACPPYWWLIASETDAGQKYFATILDFQGKLRNEINNENQILVSAFDAKNTLCESYKNDMITFKNTLGYDSELVFGDQNAWIEKGMYKYFKEAPLKFGINMARNSTHVELENKHIDLYDCDLNRVALEIKRDISGEMLSNNLFPTLVKEYGLRLRQLPESKINELRSGTLTLEQWLNKNVLEYIDYMYKEKTKRTTAVSDIDDGTRLAVVNGNTLSKIAGSNETAKLILNDQFNSQEKLNEASAKNIQFEYEQGWSKVAGVDRAFLLEEICNKRLIDAFVTGSKRDAYGQPLIFSQNIDGAKHQNIYFDQFEFDANNATSKVNFYAVVETGKGKKMAFKAENISFHPGGLAGKVYLGLATDFSFAINNVARFILKGSVAGSSNQPTSGTYVTFSCENGFEGLQIDSKVQFCRKYLTPIDPSTGQENPLESVYVEADISANIKGFHDFLVENVTFTPFVLTGHPEYKFNLQGMALDFSDLRNPSSAIFPADYWKSGDIKVGDINLWRGFYIRNFDIEVPGKLFTEKGNSQPKKIIAHDFIIDGGGVTGTVGVTNLLSKETGTISGWSFSVDEFDLKVERNVPKGAAFKGQIHIPLFDKDEYWKYSAKIMSGGEYEFAVSPVTTSKIDLWMATAILKKNSAVRIYKEGDDFIAEAKLHGLLRINNSSENEQKEKSKIDSLRFENLIISTKKPYVINAGYWSVPRSGAHISGFSFYLDKIQLAKVEENNITKTKLHFAVGLGLASDGAKGFDISAGGDFDIFGATSINSEGDQVWEYDRLQINELFLNAETKGFSIAGKIIFFRPQPVVDVNNPPAINKYGRGFQGMVKLKVGGLDKGVGIEAVGIFGRVEKSPGNFYKYFLVDVMVLLPKGNGIVGGMDLTAAGGGVYWHMRRNDPNAGFSFQTVNVSTLKPGQTLSGCVYVPTDTIGLGIRLSVGIAAADPNSFNARASFEINFNAGGGINKVYFDGIAHFLQSPAAGTSTKLTEGNAGSIPDGMHANLFMMYDVQSSTFQANLRMYAYLEGGYIRGCSGGCSTKRVGDVEIYFSPKTWFINVGRPTYAKDRNKELISMGIVSEGGNGQPAGELIVSAYFNMGHNIPEMPDIPLSLREMFGSSYKKVDAGMGANGKGIAFGARLEFKASGNFLGPLGSYDVTAGAGFDFMMVNYGNSMCSCKKRGATVNEQIGINGWYASGQLYAYVRGTASFIIGKPFSVGAGALLQVQGPNPLWIKGTVVVEACGQTRKAEVELGSKCNFVKSTSQNSNLLDNLQLITSISPDDKNTNISLRAKPEINFEFPVNKKTIVDDVSGTYDVEIKMIDLKLSNGTQDITAVLNKHVFSNNNTKLTLNPSTALPAKAKLKLEVTAVAYKNGVEIKRVPKSVEFETEDIWSKIPNDNVMVSYPQPGAMNYYIKEDNLNRGYIQLKEDQAELLYSAEELRLNIYKMTAGKEVRVADVSASYSSINKRIDFTMPNDKLTINTVYKLDLAKIWKTELGDDGLPQLTASGPREESVYTSYFSTSKYNTFWEKMSGNSVSSSVTTETIDNKVIKIPHLQFSSSTETFDRYELGLVKGYIPSVVVGNNVSQSSWYNSTNNFYNNYPKEISLPTNIHNHCYWNWSGQHCNLEVRGNTTYRIDVASTKNKGYAFNRADYLSAFKVDDQNNLPPLIDESIYKLGSRPSLSVPAKMDFELYTTVHRDMFDAAKQVWGDPLQPEQDIWTVSMNKCKHTDDGNHDRCNDRILPILVALPVASSNSVITLPQSTEFGIYYSLPVEVGDDDQASKRPEEILNGPLHNQIKQKLITKSFVTKTVQN